MSSFVSHSSLLTEKGVDLARARPFVTEIIVRIFIVAILIAEVLFKQFLIRTAVWWVEHSLHRSIMDTSFFQTIINMIEVRGTISFFWYAWIVEVLFEQFLIRNAV